MSALRYKLQGYFWQHSQWFRRPLRMLLRELALWRFRWRKGPTDGPRVVCSERLRKPIAEALPCIAVTGLSGAALEAWQAAQTETLWQVAEESAASHHLMIEGDENSCPATAVESLLLSSAAEELIWAEVVAAPPSSSPHGELSEAHALPNSTRLALSKASLGQNSSRKVLQGRRVAHLYDRAEITGRELFVAFPTTVAGAYLLHPEAHQRRVVRHQVRDIASTLAAVPAVSGPPTVLFLLPFLAVGGAERLLFDLIAGLSPRYRCLVVTTEPHREALGETVGRCRQLTPWVYTLGDWLPRPALCGAVRFLLRRYQAETLVSWNGTTLFYDRVAAWRREFPHLRIANQLYDHQGGWIQHYSAALVRSVDVHLAVNHAIAEALQQRAVSAPAVAVVHHGVAVPTRASVDNTEQRQSLRDELELPQGAVVVGSFLRLHEQKRPLDILELARRLESQDVHFLLIGGGPLDQAVDRRLSQLPLANLRRLPLHPDASQYYDAIDICLMTSSYEGLPVFLLDGLARGIPCVTTAVGEIPLLLSEGGGETAAPGDLDGLQRGLERLLDDRERARAGRQGRQRVRQHFSLEAYRQRYEQLIFPGGGVRNLDHD